MIPNSRSSEVVERDKNDEGDGPTTRDSNLEGVLENGSSRWRTGSLMESTRHTKKAAPELNFDRKILTAGFIERPIGRHYCGEVGLRAPAPSIILCVKSGVVWLHSGECVLSLDSTAETSPREGAYY
jgi:hypothetical protein